MSVAKGGRVVAVTGAGRGLGLGISRRFAEHGDAVVILDIDGAVGAEAASTLLERGHAATFVELDVRDFARVESTVGEIETNIGPVDVWVNNAGIVRRGPAETLGHKDWTDTLDVMLNGAFFCSQAVGRRMLRRGSGVIINNASVNGYFPIEGRVAYSVAKAGLVMLTQALGIEWADRGLRVAGIAPGVVRTDIVDEAIAAGAASEVVYERRTPMRRMGTVEEVAEAVFFLASDEATYITAETLRIDGGWSAYQLF